MDLRHGNIDPVRSALWILRAVDPVWNEIFRPGATTLPVPALPTNIYFFLGPSPRGRLWEHVNDPGSFQYEHLEMVSPDDAEVLALHPSSKPRVIHQRLETYRLIRGIQVFWNNIQHAPDFVGTIPNIYFVRIKM
ncbi:hypothetical protein diail_1977 [Diaporthe ilicicola]|nr:hypothetical protein diail_1977 [Diaporthe ilicicola]